MSAVTSRKTCSARRDPSHKEIHSNFAPMHSIPQTRFAKILPEVNLPPPMEVSSHGGSFGDLQRSVVGRPVSKLRHVLVRLIRKKQCCGSKKSSFRCQSTLLRHRSLVQVGSIQILRLLTRGSPQHCRRKIQGSNFKKMIFLEEQKAQSEDRFFRGRHIACMIYKCFGVIGTHESILDVTHLMEVTPRADDVQGVATRWHEVLLSMKEMPQDNVLGSLYKMRRPDSEELKTILALYDQHIPQRDFFPRYPSEVEKIWRRSSWIKKKWNRHV